MFCMSKKENRKIISADISIFMDTIEKSSYKDSNSIFEIPKSDKKIAIELNNRGFGLARRTITKYRKKNNNPSSRNR